MKSAIVTRIVGVCNCSMFCCKLLYVHSSFAIILTGKRELVTLLSLSSWCLVMDVWLFFTVPRVCLWFVIVVFSDHTHLLFLHCNCCAPSPHGNLTKAPSERQGNAKLIVRNNVFESLSFFLSFFLSFYLYWFRSYLSITPGSANLEILIK